MSSIAGDLCNRGFAVWNIEYRRIGEPLVGWDEISSDVLAALEFLQDYSERERRLDMSQVALVFRVIIRCSDIAVFVISQYGKGNNPKMHDSTGKSNLLIVGSASTLRFHMFEAP